MLSTNRIQSLMGRALRQLYEPATLQTVRRSEQRDPQTGEFAYTVVGQTPVRVQREACTVRQVSSPGYDARDVRLLILQDGVSAVPDTDSIVLYRGARYRLHAPIEEDPARVYWDARARLVP